MKRILMVLVLGMLVSGCRNIYTMQTTTGKDDIEKIKKYTAYQSKLTNKNICILTEVEAIKVTTSDPTSANALPQVSLGWWWGAWLESSLNPGGKLVFYKESHSMFSSAITGRTFIYVQNDSSKTKKVKVDIQPKFLLNFPFFKVGAGDKVVKVNITDENKK